MNRLLIAVLIALTLPLAGCGNKGPLVRPGNPMPPPTDTMPSDSSTALPASSTVAPPADSTVAPPAAGSTAPPAEPTTPAPPPADAGHG
jgi:predicted small lipoprotein YifL